jgi:heme/copper-type cytochrome/quinol oxidase subunit 1
MWFERWFLSSNAKDIGVLYLIYALFAGLIGTAFSVLIRLELSGPGVQFIADNQLYNSIITAHAIIMIFFMVIFFMLNIELIPFLFMSVLNNNDKNDIVISNKNLDHNNNNNKYVKIVIEDPIFF